MGQNSTEVAYGFGQFGSTYLTGDGAKVDLSGASAKYYICAITMTEDTTFEDLEILDGGVGLGFANTACVSDDVIDVDAAWGAVTAVTPGDSTDNKITVAVTTSHTFPKGVTIYGLWDNVELNSGACIVYVAPRPDYRNRA
jgi:hypothetical protein